MSRFITLSLVCSSLLIASACSDSPEDEAAAAAATTQEDPGLVAVAERPSGPALVTPAELVVRLDDESMPVLLDVRSPEEFAAGHIPGAINVPYDEIPSRLPELAAHRDAELIVYCRTGRRAKIAEAALREAGFTNVADLEGHMVEWTAARYPVTDPQPCC